MRATVRNSVQLCGTAGDCSRIVRNFAEFLAIVRSLQGLQLRASNICLEFLTIFRLNQFLLKILET